MSVAETPRPGEDRPILPPPKSYNREHASRPPQTSFQPITPQQQPPVAYETTHTPYRPEPPLPHPLDYSQQHPKAPVQHILHQSDLPPSFTPVRDAPFEFKSGLTQYRRLDNAPPLAQRRQAKKIGQRRDMRDEDYARQNPIQTASSRIVGHERAQEPSIAGPAPRDMVPPPHAAVPRTASSRSSLQISDLISGDVHPLYVTPHSLEFTMLIELQHA
jgi:hypothetical protein